MNNSAVGAAYIGPTRTSMDASADTVIIIEQNGSFQYIYPSVSPGTIEVHLVSPIYTKGVIEYEGERVDYTCRIMPELKGGFQLKEFLTSPPEALQQNIQQMARARAPQNYHHLTTDRKYTEDLFYEYCGKPYKLTYTYTI